MIIGHQKIIQFLNKSIANGKLAHAYLFVGSEHLGKRTMALEFAKALQCYSEQDARYIGRTARYRNSGLFSDRRSTPGESTPPTLQVVKQAADSNVEGFNTCGNCRSCQEINNNAHPDVLITEPEKIEEKGKKREKEITIEQIRNIQHQLGMFPYYGPYKIVIIDLAERMRREAANALLKTLEEPTKNTIIILISSNLGALLPTIISRCLLIKYSLVPKQDMQEKLFVRAKKVFSNNEIQRMFRLSLGRPGLAVSFVTNPSLLLEQNAVIKELISVLKGDLNIKFKQAEFLAKDLELAQEALNQWLIFFRDLILLKAGCRDLAVVNFSNGKESVAGGGIINKAFDAWSAAKLKNIIQKIIKTKQIINNPSFNARLALEVLMLNLM